MAEETDNKLEDSDPTAQVEVEVEAKGDDDLVVATLTTVVSETSAPGGCCGWNWRPTHGVVLYQNKRYEWNARGHRKLRYLMGSSEHHPSKLRGRLRLVCWEPYIVTWYNLWISLIADTLWVINGVYATWPESEHVWGNAEHISFATGVVGAFLFIVSGYMGYVEAINQTYHELRFPTATGQDGDSDSSVSEPRTFRRHLHFHYGERHDTISASLAPVDQNKILAKGYPLVYDDESKELINAKEYFNQEKEAFLGKNLSIEFGGHTIGVQITSFDTPTEGKQISSLSASSKGKDSFKGYLWWTWQPDLQYIGIANALVFFVATIIFFIPAVVWFPMANHGSPTPSVVFWGYVLQIIPSVAFVYVGWATMAEATGSWFRPQCNNVGCWIGLFNFIGGIGFLLYPILYLPSVVSPDKDHGNLPNWGASFATFWGSCAFLLAGILQWIEFSSQHPIIQISPKWSSIESPDPMTRR